MTSFEQQRKRLPHPSPLTTKSADSEIATPTLNPQTVQRARSLPDTLRPTDVQFLQSSMGNAAVSNLLGRNQSQRAQPAIVQRQPLSNTIQRNEDEESEDSTDESDHLDSNVDEFFSEDESDAFEDESDVEEEQDAPDSNWSYNSYFNQRYGLPSNIPAYQSSPEAVRKKLGVRHRLWNRVAHRGALAVDRLKNKATGGSSMPLTERVEAKASHKRNKADEKLMWKHYESHLPRKARKRLRKQYRQENQAYDQNFAASEKAEKQRRKEQKADLKWIKKRYNSPMVDF